MGNPLFDRRAASDFGAAGLVIDFKEKVGSFDRLSAAVELDLSALEDGHPPENWRELPVTGELKFGFSAEQSDVATLTGRVRAEVAAVCQRCLETFPLRLDADLSLLLRPIGVSVAEQPGFDIWELAEPSVSAADVVDEILVMTMPISARHEEENCAAARQEPDAAEDTTRPFANLREQMDRNDNKG